MSIVNSESNIIEKRSQPPHIVRPMTIDDVDECLRLFAINGLAETTGGLKTYVQLEPNGYHVAVHSETGENFYSIHSEKQRKDIISYDMQLSR